VTAREDGLTNEALSLSPSRTLVTPYCKRIRPGRRINTSRGSLFCSSTRSDNLLIGPGTPLGSKRRQLARQVGAYCVLTNSFPSSSRWVVSSNLSSPGRCSVSGVSSSCPSTVATTWYSFLRRATTTMAAVSPPAAAQNRRRLPPHGGREASGSVPSPSPLTKEEAGQPWPSRRRHLVGCRASRRRRRPNGGHGGR
jgi:hypothetical protein